MKNILLTTIITFVIAGIGGTMFKEWIDRPQPSVIIRAIGFTGGGEQIEIPERVRDLTRESAWSDTLKRYETYKRINNVYREIRQIKLRLESATKNVDKWQKDKSAWKDNNQAVDITEILLCPFTQDNIIGGTLLGAASRSELGLPPLNIKDIDNLPTVADMTETGDGWSIYLQRMNVLFPLGKKNNSEKQKQAIHCMALSFSKGSSKNIYFYMSQFLQRAYQDIAALDNLVREIESILLPESYITVEASFCNVGSKPDTIYPFCALKYLHEDLNSDTTIMALTPASAMNSSASDNHEENESADVRVDEFLPKGAGSEYAFLLPNNEVRMRLQARTKLGNVNGRRIQQLYASEVLKCELICRTISGRIVKSGAFSFGQNISKQRLDKISDELTGR